jgi:predicted phosphodiesterase
MKILALSDLHWNRESKTIKLSETLKMTPLDVLSTPEFSQVRKYFNIIHAFTPDLVIFCGDITGDGPCGHGYTSPLIGLFKLIESKGIKARYISGNHDEPQYYEEVIKYSKKSILVKELTHKIEIIGDLRILGLSFDQTESKTAFNKVFTSEKVDIVVCHCSHTKRLNLFDFNTDFIISGHYDLKVINPNNKTFISLDNDEPQGKNFAVIETDKDKKLISFFIDKSNRNELIHFIFRKKEESFDLIETNYIPKDSSRYNNIYYIDNVQFKNAIEILLKKKHLRQKINSKELTDLLKIKINFKRQISKSFIDSYL